MSLESKQSFVSGLEKAYGSKLRRYLAARMRGAAADVPDLMQEVFLRLLRLDDYEAIRNTQAYLYTVASHVLHQYTLRQAAAPTTTELADLPIDFEPADVDPAHEVEAEQHFEHIGQGLRKEAPRAYATLLLHRCHGLSLYQVSERLGVSYSMTKKDLARALKYIEHQFEQAKEAP